MSLVNVRDSQIRTGPSNVQLDLNQPRIRKFVKGSNYKIELRRCSKAVSKCLFNVRQRVVKTYVEQDLESHTVTHYANSNCFELQTF